MRGWKMAMPDMQWKTLDRPDDITLDITVICYITWEGR